MGTLNNDLGAVVTGMLALAGGGGVWTWLSARQKANSEARVAQATGVAALIEGNNKLSQMLLNERTDRERAIDRLTGEVEGLRGELRERGEQLEQAEDDRRLLWLYVGQLETLLREGGTTLPARPPRLTDTADHHTLHRPQPRKKP